MSRDLRRGGRRDESRSRALAGATQRRRSTRVGARNRGEARRDATAAECAGVTAAERHPHAVGTRTNRSSGRLSDCQAASKEDHAKPAGDMSRLAGSRDYASAITRCVARPQARAPLSTAPRNQRRRDVVGGGRPTSAWPRSSPALLTCPTVGGRASTARSARGVARIATSPSIASVCSTSGVRKHKLKYTAGNSRTSFETSATAWRQVPRAQPDETQRCRVHRPAGRRLLDAGGPRERRDARRRSSRRDDAVWIEFPADWQQTATHVAFKGFNSRSCQAPAPVRTAPHPLSASASPPRLRSHAAMKAPADDMDGEAEEEEGEEGRHRPQALSASSDGKLTRSRKRSRGRAHRHSSQMRGRRRRRQRTREEIDAMRENLDDMPRSFASNRTRRRRRVWRWKCRRSRRSTARWRPPPTRRPRRRPADCRPPPTRRRSRGSTPAAPAPRATRSAAPRWSSRCSRKKTRRALEKLEAIANGFEAAGDHYHAAVARELRARFLEPEM